MQGDYFIDGDGGLVFKQEVGPHYGPAKPNPGKTRPVVRQAGATSFQRRGQRIASPGVLEDLRYWWGKLPWWGKALAVGGPAMLFLALAARKTEEIKKA